MKFENLPCTCVDNFQPDVFKFFFLENQGNIFSLHFVCAANNLLSIVHSIIQIQSCILTNFKLDFLKNEILSLFSLFILFSFFNHAISETLEWIKKKLTRCNDFSNIVKIIKNQTKLGK